MSQTVSWSSTSDNEPVHHDVAEKSSRLNRPGQLAVALAFLEENGYPASMQLLCRLPTSLWTISIPNSVLVFFSGWPGAICSAAAAALAVPYHAV